MDLPLRDPLNPNEDLDGITGRSIMTSSGESRKEATRTTPIISTRTTTNIAAWNVQTMYQTGKLYQVEKEFERYNLSILGISESRWKG